MYVPTCNTTTEPLTKPTDTLYTPPRTKATVPPTTTSGMYDYYSYITT